MEMPIVDLSASPGLPSVDGQAAKADRIRALELSDVRRGTAAQVLAFINGESTTTLQAPLAQLLQSCYTVFQAQDMKDHVAVFDRVTDMRDAFGGVLAAMDELGIPRPRVEGAMADPADTDPSITLERAALLAEEREIERRRG